MVREELPNEAKVNLCGICGRAYCTEIGATNPSSTCVGRWVAAEIWQTNAPATLTEAG